MQLGKATRTLWPGLGHLMSACEGGSALTQCCPGRLTAPSAPAAQLPRGVDSRELEPAGWPRSVAPEGLSATPAVRWTCRQRLRVFPSSLTQQRYETGPVRTPGLPRSCPPSRAPCAAEGGPQVRLILLGLESCHLMAAEHLALPTLPPSPGLC